MTTETKGVIAVSETSLREFGCPYCGYRSGHTPISGSGSSAWVCGSKGCGERCCVLADGLAKSRMAFGGKYPELQPHPRQGIPSHGEPDVRPGPTGEFFRSRGIGMDRCDCFVCGRRDNTSSVFMRNIAAFVQCKEAGERVVAMFACGARLDYREFEPDYVQVKIGACEKHVENLEKLNELVKDGIITTARVREATGEQGIDLDELQTEAEKLGLKDREHGLIGWNICMRERLTKLHSLIVLALNK